MTIAINATINYICIHACMLVIRKETLNKCTTAICIYCISSLSIDDIETLEKR